MSIAPLRRRLCRLLAVVSSGLFIVLMLGTGSHADQTNPAALPSAFSSKPLQNHFNPRPPLLRYVQIDDATCVSCIFATQKQCNDNGQTLLGVPSLTEMPDCSLKSVVDWCYLHSYCPRNYQPNPIR